MEILFYCLLALTILTSVAGALALVAFFWSLRDWLMPLFITCFVVAIFAGIGTNLAYINIPRLPIVGTVISKSHSDAYAETTIVPMVTSTGKSTTTIMVPITTYHPERWTLTVRIQTEEVQKDAQVHVSQAYWNAVAEGHWFEERQTDIDSRPDVKKREPRAEAEAVAPTSPNG